MDQGACMCVYGPRSGVIHRQLGNFFVHARENGPVLLSCANQLCHSEPLLFICYSTPLFLCARLAQATWPRLPLPSYYLIHT